jgi:hypothetical protein
VSEEEEEEDSDDSFAEQVRRQNEEIKKQKEQSDNSQVIGPMPLILDKNFNHRTNYGSQLLPGEGSVDVA